MVMVPVSFVTVTLARSSSVLSIRAMVDEEDAAAEEDVSSPVPPVSVRAATAPPKTTTQARAIIRYLLFFFIYRCLLRKNTTIPVIRKASGIRTVNTPRPMNMICPPDIAIS